MNAREIPLVVVGIDGSAGSDAALQWAEAYAHATGASIELLVAWHWPTSYGVPLAWDGFDPAEDARVLADKAAANVGLPNDRVTTAVAAGAAGDCLVKAAAGADLLVVGSRGHGGLSAALLGSVSTYCAQHAPCPVVIVR